MAHQNVLVGEMMTVLAVVVAASLSSSVPAKTYREVVISSSMVHPGVGEERQNREIVV